MEDVETVQRIVEQLEVHELCGSQTKMEKISHYEEECDMIWAEVIDARRFEDEQVSLICLVFYN